MADGTFKGLAGSAPVYASYVHSGAAAGQLDAFFFVADDYYEVVEVRVNHSVDGGAGAQVDIKKVATAGVLASGVSVLASVFSLASGALTSQRRKLSEGTLTTTAANRALVPGDSLAVDFSGTLTSMVGPAVVVVLKRLRKISRR